MKQANRIKKLQRFLFDTGRMVPDKRWNRRVRDYPGNVTYVIRVSVNSRFVKITRRTRHLECAYCFGTGRVYVGHDDLNPVDKGFRSCPKCDGFIWSKKAYRF